MSIFKSKILTFVIALFCLIPFSFAFVGCGEKASNPDDNGNNNQNNQTVVTVDAAYASAATQLQSALRNATMTFDMSYIYGAMDQPESQKGVLKIANNAIYAAELDAQGNVVSYSYTTGGKTYDSRQVWTSATNHMQLFGYSSYSNSGFDPVAMIDANLVASELDAYKKIATFFNPTNPVKVEVVDGNVVLTIGADIATYANKLLANVKANYNTSLTAFLNQLIDDTLGQPALAEGAEVPADRVTVSTLLDTMFANLTDETTFGDVINALPAVLKNRVETILPMALSGFEGMTPATIKAMPVIGTLDMALGMIPNEIKANLPFDLDDLYVDVLDDQEQPTGETEITAESIKEFIEAFLNNNSIDSIAGFVMTMIGSEVQVQNQLQSQPVLDPEPEQGEEPAAEPGFLDSYIAMLEGVSVSKAAFNVVVTFNANNVLTGFDMIADGAIAMGQASMGANATISVQFSNIGTTTIEVPASINYFDDSLDVTAAELAAHLNAQTGWYEFELDTIPFAYNVQRTESVYNQQTEQDDQVVVASYDKTTNTVKFLKSYYDTYHGAMYIGEYDDDTNQYHFYFGVYRELA